MRIALYVIIAIIFSSCRIFRVYYAPNTANVPLLTEKGEMHINGGVAATFESALTGGELQIAFAPKERIGIHGSFFHAGQKNTRQMNSDKITYAEFGFGYFTTLSKSKRWPFEVYAGSGFGSMNTSYGEGNSSRIQFRKVYLQPTIGLKLATFHFELAFAPKASFVHWEVKSFSGGFDRLTVDNFLYIGEKKNFFVFESTGLLRAGGEKLKLQLGITLSDSFTEYGYAPREPVVFHAGLSLRLLPKKKNEDVNKQMSLIN